MIALAASALPLATLLPARTRPQIEALFAFLRGDGSVPVDADVAGRLRDAIEKHARTTRIRRWSELLAWCRFTAQPAAAHVLALHGEDARLAPAAEALGTAVLLLRIVRDCRADYADGGRIYLPGDWLREAGSAEADLGAPRASPMLRRVLDRVIERAERLLAEARPGFAAIRDPALRRWAETTLALAEAWAKALRTRDPVARPVSPGALVRWRAYAVGFLRARRR